MDSLTVTVNPHADRKRKMRPQPERVRLGALREGDIVEITWPGECAPSPDIIEINYGRPLARIRDQLLCEECAVLRYDVKSGAKNPLRQTTEWASGGSQGEVLTWHRFLGEHMLICSKMDKDQWLAVINGNPMGGLHNTVDQCKAQCELMAIEDWCVP